MKKLLFSFVILWIIVYSVISPAELVYGARDGIEIWFYQILPTLLPFSIASSVLIKSNFLKSFSGNGTLLACLLTTSCGFLFGFPIGAKLSADFYKQELLSEKQATLLAIATNNFSPVYVCGFALPLLLSNADYIPVTYVILYLLPLALVTVYLMATARQQPLNATELSSPKSFQLDMSIVDSGILCSFETLIKLCGYIVLFSIGTKMLASLLEGMLSQPALPLIQLLGNMEITNGIQLLSKTKQPQELRYICAIQLLSLGGISGLAQTGSILSGAKLSMHKYIIGKAALSLLLTLLSVIYVCFIRLL